MEKISEAQIYAIREFPIECLIRKARNEFYDRLAHEPIRESILNLRSLLVTSEWALESILAVDSKIRPTDEWLAAIDEVESIRDEALEMIHFLENS